jgi:CheY-like chemotaxis protein
MTHILALIPAPKAAGYTAYFRESEAVGSAGLRVVVVDDPDEARARLQSREPAVDVLVLDNTFDQAYDLITALRARHPRLIIVLVDDDADFATPGQADDISTEPFKNDDLIRRIQRLLADRGLETLRADAMPPIREFAKQLRKAIGEIGKQQAAVSACRSLGYEYVAYYAQTPLGTLSRTAHEGAPVLVNAAPHTADPNDVVAWVARTGQNRTVRKGDTPSFVMLERGLLSVVVCAPVGRTNRYGVLVAGRESQPAEGQQVLLLDLISAQLAAVLSKQG